MTNLDRLEHFMQTWRHTTVSRNPPASSAQIEAAEKAMHVRLPAEVRAAYRRFNGVKRDELPPVRLTRPRGPALFLYSYDWVDLDRMVNLWRMMVVIDAGFRDEGLWYDVPEGEIAPHLKARPLGWHRKWIPIADHGTFDKMYIDLAPTKVGVRGQIVHAGNGGPVVAAVGFNSYIERLLDGYESGKLVLDSECSWRTPAGTLVGDLAAAGA